MNQTEHIQKYYSTSINKERISYIDVAKGILILFVVYDHLPDIYMYILKLSNSHIEWLDEWQWVYKIFFMPAFFCITGMCSNFNKKFMPFLISNLKTLILPNIVFGVILHKDILGIFLHGGAFWFLSALFLSKIVYYYINSISKSSFIRFSILLLLVFVGFSLNSIPVIYDLWFFHYAFCLTVFLELGKIIKELDSSKLKFFSCVYVIACILMFFADIHKPIVALDCNCQIYEAPLYVLSAFSGSCLIIYFSKIINSNQLLQFFGKESLIFYMFQIRVLLFVEKRYLNFFEVDGVLSVIQFVIVVYLVSILILSVVSHILETKYFSFLIGKF